MTPLELIILIEVCICDIPGANIPKVWDSEVGKKTRERFQVEGLINEDEKATAGARLWLEEIQKTPAPIHRWITREQDKSLKKV